MIQKSLEESTAIGSISLMTLFTNGVYLKPLLISMVVMFLQQFSGINAVVSYAVTIFKVSSFILSNIRKDVCFQDAGTSIDPFISNILISVSQVVFTAVSMVLVDRFMVSFGIFLVPFMTSGLAEGFSSSCQTSS